MVGQEMLLWGGGRDLPGTDSMYGTASSFFPRSEIFTWNDGSWTKREAQARLSDHMPPPCGGAVCTVVGDIVYSFAGSTSERSFNDIYVLKDRRIWEKLPVVGEVPTPRLACGLSAVEQSLYSFGGYLPVDCWSRPFSPPGREHWVRTGDFGMVTDDLLCFDLKSCKNVVFVCSVSVTFLVYKSVVRLCWLQWFEHCTVSVKKLKPSTLHLDFSALNFHFHFQTRVW